LCIIQTIVLLIVKIINPEMVTSAGQMLLIAMLPIMSIIAIGLLMAVVGGVGWAVKATIRRN